MASFSPEVRTSSNPSLPIIDLSKWTSPSASKSDRLALAKELVYGCHTTGFVYIINHGVSSSLLEEAFAWSKKFHVMPQDKKMQAGHPEGSESFRGYSWPGHENIGSLDPWADQKIGSASKELKRPEENKEEDKAIDYTASYGIGSDDNTDDASIWLPEATLPGFRAFMTKFYWECWKTSQEVFRAIALGLGFEDEEYLLQFHSGHDNELALRYYPPVAKSAVENCKVKRMSPHTDFDSLTLLFQDDCGGLEVQKPGVKGEFIAADPIKNALVMNIGDALMRWSNDYLISTIHRVHLPPLQDRYTGKERMTRGRYSIPYFVCPTRETLMECLPVCHSKENPPKYEPMLYSDYYKQCVAEYFQN